MTTEPAAAAADDAQVVRDAVEALLSIGCWGLHDSNRPEVWAIGLRAKRVLDGNPMTEAEAAEFLVKARERLARSAEAVAQMRAKRTALLDAP